jgi:hypothetical protein
MDPIFNFEGFVPAQIQQALESAYRSKRRIRVWYGFTEYQSGALRDGDKHGLSWGDDFEVVGTVGRSTGRVKIPLLVNNARSLGGPAILVTSIVRIDDIASRTHLFKHPAFRSDFEQSAPIEIPAEDHFYEQGYRYTVKNDRGQTQANFKTKRAAQNFIDFQNRSRYSK